MKKRNAAISMIAAMSMFMLFGCGKKQESLAALDTSKYVTLGEYSGMTVSVEPPAVITDEEVENYLNRRILASYVENNDVTDRPVQNGDTVYYTCVGKMDGEVFEGGSTPEGQEWNTIIGSGQMIEGFEEGMVGMEIGETKDVPCTFPDPYEPNPDYSGKEAVFTITVKSITTQTYPELTGELLQQMGAEYETPEEMRAAIRTYLENSAQSVYEDDVRRALLSAALANCEFQEPPAFLVERNEQAFRDSMLYEASNYGFSDVVSFAETVYGITEEQFNEQVHLIGVSASKETILIEAIADAQGLGEISDDELRAEAEAYVAELSGYYESVEALYEAVGKDTFRDYIVSERVGEWLKENNTIEYSAAGDSTGEDSTGGDSGAESH